MVEKSSCEDVTSFEIVKTVSVIESENVAQYGIKMYHAAQTAQVLEISDCKQIVLDLIKIFEQDGVTTYTLEELVESYITEKYTFNI